MNTDRTTVAIPEGALPPTPAGRPFNLWDGLSPAEAEQLRSRLEPVTVKPGECFIRHREKDACLYLIDEGLVEVRRAGKTLANLHSGHVVGEMALFNKEPRNADVLAVTDCRLSRLAAKDFESLCRRMPALKLVLTRLVAHRLDWSGSDVLARRIGRYQVLEHLGFGSMGWVFRATHQGTTYALKMLPHSLVQQPRFLDRYRTEARLLRRLRHENIVSLCGVLEQYGTIFLVLEFVPGMSVQEWIDLDGLPSVADTRSVVQSVIRALRTAHERGVVHRDVKPSNVMLTYDGIVKLVDFGIAMPFRNRRHATETAMTPAYAAPEQFKTARIGPPADFFSLGIMTYQLLTGHLPSQDELLRNTLPPLKDCGRAIPAELQAFVKAALTRDQLARHTALQMVFQEWPGLDTPANVAKPPKHPPPTTPPPNP